MQETERSARDEQSPSPSPRLAQHRKHIAASGELLREGCREQDERHAERGRKPCPRRGRQPIEPPDPDEQRGRNTNRQRAEEKPADERQRPSRLSVETDLGPW